MNYEFGITLNIGLILLAVGYYVFAERLGYGLVAAIIRASAIVTIAIASAGFMGRV